MRWTVAQLADYTRRRLKGTLHIDGETESITRLSRKQPARDKMQHEQTNPNLGGLQNPKPKHDPASALDKSARRSQKVTSRLASRSGQTFRVSIISVRHKLADSDNICAGAKWLRDAVAGTIGIDDAEGSGIIWEYHQYITKGQEGTIVTIEKV